MAMVTMEDDDNNNNLFLTSSVDIMPNKNGSLLNIDS